MLALVKSVVCLIMIDDICFYLKVMFKADVSCVVCGLLWTRVDMVYLFCRKVRCKANVSSVV